MSELEAVKLGKAADQAGAAKRRRVKGDTLRDRQPWLGADGGGCQVSCRCRTAAWGGRPTGTASAPIGMGGFTTRQQFELLGVNRTI